MELIEVEAIRTAPPRRPLRRAAAAVGVMLLGAAAIAAWQQSRGDSPDLEHPLPTAVAREGDVSLEQAVALAWADWQAQVETSSCLAEHGFTWTPALGGAAWVTPAAQRLGVTPAYVDIPARADAVDPITFELDTLRIGESDQWYAPVEDGGCVTSPPLINIADSSGVRQALDSAAADGAFLHALAGAAWKQQHPEAWLALWNEAYFAIDREPLDDAAAASKALDDAVEIAADATSWVPIGTHVTDLSASAYGVDGAGHIVVISVEQGGAAHPVTWAFGGSARDQLHCAQFQVLIANPSLASGAFVRDELSGAIWSALEQSWCGGTDANARFGAEAALG